MNHVGPHFIGSTTHTSPPAGGKLLIDIKELARLTSLSVRTLRRMDAAGDIPGRVLVGRRVLFRVGAIETWAGAGLPPRELWPVQLPATNSWQGVAN